MTFGWFSVFHLLMIAALLIPNGIYMLQNKQAKNKCASRCMNVLEQIGRYGCMLLMILSVEGGTSDDLLAGQLDVPAVVCDDAGKQMHLQKIVDLHGAGDCYGFAVPAVRHYPARLDAHSGSCHICPEPSVCHVV